MAVGLLILFRQMATLREDELEVLLLMCSIQMPSPHSLLTVSYFVLFVILFCSVYIFWFPCYTLSRLVPFFYLLNFTLFNSSSTPKDILEPHGLN